MRKFLMSHYLSVSALLFAAGVILIACDRDDRLPRVQSKEQHSEATAARSQTVDNSSSSATQFNIGNRSYLFDVSEHSREELEALLQRAQEISQLKSENYDQLEIVLILHGPDIDWFTRQNYDQNKNLVDLAARLDAFNIIDLKVCESTMINRNVNREELPPFIESVPYAPDEINRLLQENFINL